MWHYLIHFLSFVVIAELFFDRPAFCWTKRLYQYAYKVNYRLGGYVVFIDLDGFKMINDLKGHPEGDRILANFGKILFSVSRGRSFHYGGDEFCLLTFSSEIKKVEEIVGEIKNRAEISFSYGIAKNEEEANQKMYRDKKNKGRE